MVYAPKGKTVAASTFTCMRYVLFVVLIATACVYAEANNQEGRFNYQAKMTGTSGAPLEGSHTLFFSVFVGGDDSTANSGALIYSESVSATISRGVVSHTVGTGNSPAGTLDATTLGTSSTTFLQVAVDVAGNVILPRVRLQPVPYATVAGVANNVSANVSQGLVPSGSFIMTTSTVAPAGYTFTGNSTSLSLSGEWSVGPKAPMPTARWGLAAAAVNGKVYAIGGYTAFYSAANEEYDPATNTWAAKAPMPTARYFLAAAAVNNKVYAIGGTSGTYSAANEEYDPATNTWAAKAPMPTARAGLVAAAVNGRVYAIGGLTGTNSAANEEYNPAANTWAAKAPMLTARFGHAAAVVNNKVYAIGGWTGAYSAANEEYNPAANTWAAKAAMPTARRYLAAAAVNGRVYAIGGYTGANSAANEEYDPAANTWAAKAPMPTARGDLAAAAVNNKIYAIGGTTGASSAVNEEFTPPDPGLTTLYVHRKN